MPPTTNATGAVQFQNSTTPPPQHSAATAVWTDEAGNVWSTRITVNTIRRVRERLSINLLAIFEGDLLSRIADDPELLVNVIYVVCEPTAEERGISDEAFGELLVGDTIEQAASALIEGLCGFFPRGRREVLKKMWSKTNQTQARAMQMVDRKIDSPQVEVAISRLIEAEEAAIDQRLSSSGSTSGKYPALSEQTLDR